MRRDKSTMPREWAGKGLDTRKGRAAFSFWRDHDLARVGAKCLGHFIGRWLSLIVPSVAPGCLPDGVLSLNLLFRDSGGTVWGCLGFVTQYLLILKKKKKISECHFFQWLFKYILIICKGQGWEKKNLWRQFYCSQPNIAQTYSSLGADGSVAEFSPARLTWSRRPIFT